MWESPGSFPHSLLIAPASLVSPWNYRGWTKSCGNVCRCREIIRHQGFVCGERSGFRNHPQKAWLGTTCGILLWSPPTLKNRPQTDPKPTRSETGLKKAARGDKKGWKVNKNRKARTKTRFQGGIGVGCKAQGRKKDCPC